MRTTLLTVAVAAAALAAPAGSLRKTKPIAETEDAPAAVQSAPLFRKTMVIIGDSYVANHKRPTEEAWHYRLAEKYQMKYFNYGKNGNTLVLPREDGWGAPMVRRYKEMHTPADYVVVVAGHNDAGRLKEDEEGGAERVEQFREGVKTLAQSLKAKYPDAKIVFVSPWNVDRAGFATVLKTYRELLPSLGVAFYDAATNAGIDPNDPDVRKSLFQGPTDTAHLNAKGHAQMLEKVEPFFLSL